MMLNAWPVTLSFQGQTSRGQTSSSSLVKHIHWQAVSHTAVDLLA